MSSNKNEAEKLPDGWVLCNSKSTPGRVYYFNTKTGKSLWSHPKDQTSKAEDKNEQYKQRSKREKTEKKKGEPQKNLKRRSSGQDDPVSSKKSKTERGPENHKLSEETPDKDRPPPKKIPTKEENTKKTLAITLKKESPKKPLKSQPYLTSSNSSKETVFIPNPIISQNSRVSEPTPNHSRSQSSSRLSTETTPNCTKNLAYNRLSKLRAQLDSEVSENGEKCPTKRQAYSSPKSFPIETKTSKYDSPSIESKILSHSPSESIYSIPSPSQFLTANKIISSMKAQLLEEYSSKTKPKDTFAEIEEGICNQTAEYSMKHPATPPQFSEASKLVSAIKSKLTYKIPTKEEVRLYSTAKDRMEALRNRLSNESDEKQEIFSNSISNNTFEKRLSKSEDMEVEESQEVKQITPFQSSNRNDSLEVKENPVLVVDTNVFIHELDVIKNVLNSHIKGYTEQPVLLVPWRVINELDRLKDNNNGNGAICKRARSAMDYLYKSLPENSRIKGQSLRDSNSHIYPCESPDDEILNCCLQQAERGKSVILLSNDKNLCNKACINRVKCITLAELRTLLENKPQPTVDPELYVSVKHYEDTMHQLLANILESEMRAKYNNLWQHVIFKAPPWSLEDVLQCLLKHWIAVFSEVFPRIEPLISDLKNALVSIHSKDPNTLSSSEVSNFKELCLDVATKCQIIPEYMQLAKTTVERLVNNTTNDEHASEMVVIDAFEELWTVLSSYCAKLSSALGIPHTIEDKLGGVESMEVLSGKWENFSSHIRALTEAMKSIVQGEGSVEQMCRLSSSVQRALATLKLSGSGAISWQHVRMFYRNCRNMMQEAYSKFTALTELLDICQNQMPH